MKYGAARVDDALQNSIDNGDCADYISYLISMTFIPSANDRIISGAILYCVAHHPESQEKIYEIKAVANATPEIKSLVQQLDSLDIKCWENMSASLDLYAMNNTSACESLPHRPLE
jgi:hypothetical protein